MNHFLHPDHALSAKNRLEELSGLALDQFFELAFVGNVAPDVALTNLERWLRTTSNPSLYLEQIVNLPPVGRILLSMFGASQPIADTLIQNPELASLIFEASELRRIPRPESMRDEGLRLLSASTSHLHALDRLRFLRQRWNLPIAINDFSGAWEQEVVWKALSDLADVLIQLAADVEWEEYAKQKNLDHRPEMMIVGFGKLGGQELNYSSDVDLVYVVEDGLEEKVDRDCTRYFENFGRALSDRMGRGSLYRVDLRLRPYGGAGPILRSMRAYEAYYRLYAEPWEVQALLRSKPIVGSPALIARWNEMRRLHCFRPTLSEISLEQMLSMKARIESGAAELDLKRGEGGIRDVEFLTQILQMIHGHDRPELQVLSTCDAIRALESAGVLEHSIATALVEGYTFLRKLEHRTQLVGDQQTHSIPSSPEAREGLAKMMGCDTWANLSQMLANQRKTIQAIYRSTLKLEPKTSEDRSQVLQSLGPLGASALNWFDGLPESAAFYKGLITNEGSLERVRSILSNAPRLINQFKSSVSLTELLMSGEIEEIDDPWVRIQKLPVTTELPHLADLYVHAQTALLARWVLNADFSIGPCLAKLADTLLEHCAKRLAIQFDIIALGSYGTEDLGPGSDADMLLLVEDRTMQSAAEGQAQKLLALLSQLKRIGVPIEFDLRLRPEGSKGLLVRTFDGLRAYDLDGMEMWERFALGHARQVYGNPASLAVVLHCAHGLPLTPERLTELTKMKRRIETERVSPQHVRRQIKLGIGGLSDIEWLVHLHEMRYPTATKAGETTLMEARIQNLVNARLINAVEGNVLSDAHAFLVSLRIRIFLIGIEEDLLPENPDKLDRLAASCGFTEGNLLLARYQTITEAVRQLYLEALERLKS